MTSRALNGHLPICHCLSSSPTTSKTSNYVIPTPSAPHDLSSTDLHHHLVPLLYPVDKEMNFQASLPDLPPHSSPEAVSISPEDLVCQAYPSPSPPLCLSTLPSSHSSNAISPVTPPLPNPVPRLLPPIVTNGISKDPSDLPNPFSSEKGLQPPASLTSISPPPIRIENATVQYRQFHCYTLLLIYSCFFFCIFPEYFRRICVICHLILMLLISTTK